MAFNLASGVTYSHDLSPIRKGMESIYGSMGQIIQSKIQDEQSKQKLYDELLGIGIDEVKGRYQDEAIGLKQQMLTRASKIFSESEGMPDMAAMREISDMKNKLTNYSKMYTGLEDWYKQSAMTAAKIEDPEYQKRTSDNIQDIMTSSSLTEAWNKILSQQWLELPPKDVDIFKMRRDVINMADYDPVKWEATGKDEFGKIIYEGWKGRNPEQIRQGAEYIWNDEKDAIKHKYGIQTLDEFVEFIGTGNMTYGSVKSPNATKGKTLPSIPYNEGVGSWQFAHFNKGKGIPIAAFTDPNSKEQVPMKGAAVVEVKPDPNFGMMAKVVAPELSSISLDEVTKNISDPAEKEAFIKQLVMVNPTILKGAKSKDPINLREFWVPYYMVQTFVESSLSLSPKGESTAEEDPDNLGL